MTDFFVVDEREKKVENKIIIDWKRKDSSNGKRRNHYSEEMDGIELRKEKKSLQ